jgi:hypothetical protein
MNHRIIALLIVLALAADAHAQSFPNPPLGTPYAKHGSTYEPNAEATPAWVECTNCSTGGGSDATAAKQDIGHASRGSIDGKLPAFCASVPLGAAWNANGAETDAAATLTGICPSGTCKRLIVRNWDTTNSVMVQFNSSTGTAGVCINPASAAGQPTSIDSSLWVAPSVGVTNVYRTTTGANNFIGIAFGFS